MDLTPALEFPAPDQDPELSATNVESFNVSSTLALNYCRKIRDRFATLDVQLVERLGEANALRTLRNQQRLPVLSGENKEDIHIDIEPDSEPIFSDSDPRFTETTGSTFPSTRPSDSIFERPYHQRQDVDTVDTLSQATFASFSTSSSIRGQGRPRVPPLPVQPGSNKLFRCIACGEQLVAPKTRRAWKFVHIVYNWVFADQLR